MINLVFTAFLHASSCLSFILAETSQHQAFDLTFISDSVKENGGKTGLTCEAVIHYESNYGQFSFPETISTIEGTPAFSDCPCGVLDSGAEILEELERKRIPLTSGGVNYCFKIENDDGTLATKWDNFTFDGCRTQYMDRTISNVKCLTSLPVNEYNVRQLMPRLLPLLYNSYSDYKSAETLVTSINQVLESFELFNDGDPIMEQIKTELFQYLEYYLWNVKINTGEKVRLTSKDITLESVILPENICNQFTYDFQTCRISNEAIRMSNAGNNTIASPRLIFKVYKGNLLQHWKSEKISESTGSIHDGTSVSNNTSKMEDIGSSIFDIEFTSTKIENLTDPISYKMSFFHEFDNYNFLCVFWDDKRKTWNNEGIETILLRDQKSVLCQSSHLTAFSILLSLQMEEENASILPKTEQFDHLLSILSSICSALSIFGLLLTILAYSICRNLRCERSNRILINLCISLILLHCWSLLAAEKLWNGNCLIVSICLHYFLITSFAWMLADAFMMFQLLIMVFVQPESHFILKRILICWGAPVFLIIVTALVDLSIYKTGRDNVCVIAGHLNEPLYYCTYLGPVIIMIFLNVFVFGKIIGLLIQQNSKRIMQKKSNMSSVQMKGALSLFIVFGIGWILGLFTTGTGEVVMAFRCIHTILNGGQGLIIFVLRVLLDKKVIKALRLATFSEADSSNSSTTRTSTVSSSVITAIAASFK